MEPTTPQVESIPGGAPAQPIKPGYQTTEFWITLLVVLASFGSEIASVLPSKWAVIVATVSAAIYKLTRLILKFPKAFMAELNGTSINLDDVFPAGGSGPTADGSPSITKTQSPTPDNQPQSGSGVGMTGVALIALICASLFNGCATTTGNPGRDRSGRVTNALLSIAARDLGQFAFFFAQNAAAQSVNSHTVDFASAASKGLWSSLPNIVNSSDLESIIKANAGPAAPEILSATSPSIEAASTPAEAKAVAVAIASGFDRETPAASLAK